jgi:hypothetical protein
LLTRQNHCDEVFLEVIVMQTVGRAQAVSRIYCPIYYNPMDKEYQQLMGLTRHPSSTKKIMIICFISKVY